MTSMTDPSRVRPMASPVGTAFFVMSGSASRNDEPSVCVIDGCPGGAEIDIVPTPMKVRYAGTFAALRSDAFEGDQRRCFGTRRTDAMKPNATAVITSAAISRQRKASHSYFRACG